MIARLVRLLGDAISLLTLAFLAATPVARRVEARGEQGLSFVTDAADLLEGALGPYWWAIILVLGLLMGISIRGVVTTREAPRGTWRDRL